MLYVPPTTDVSSPLNLLLAEDAEPAAGTDWVATSNASVAIDTSVTLNGTSSLKITATASGSPADAQIPVYNYPASPGVTYTFLASFLAAATAEPVYLFAYWYDVNGTYLGNSHIGGTDATSRWTQLALTATAPASTAWVGIGAQIATVAAAGEVHHIAQIAMYESAAPVNLVPDTSDLGTWPLGGTGAYIAPSVLGGNEVVCPTADLASNLYADSQSFPVAPSTSYVISAFVDNSQGTAGSYIAVKADSSGFLAISYAAGFRGVVSGVITTNASDAFGRFHFNAPPSGNSNGSIIFAQPQLVLGSTAPAYTPGMNWWNPGSSTPWKRFLRGIAPQGDFSFRQ